MPARRPLGVFAALSSLALIVTAQSAAAQAWPIRPVTLVVPFAAGSASDTVSRIFAGRLSEVLGQQVVIENVGGAGGMTGVARVAKAPPDGYQFVLGGVDTFAQNQTLYKRPLYHALTDFMPVVLAVDQPLLLLARNELPVHDLREFIAYAKANQAKMQYGSAGVGSGSHLACARMNSAMGIDTTHVPYRGSAPAMQDLIAGRIDYFCALAALCRDPERPRTGPDRFRRLFLERFFPARRQPGAGRAAAARCHGRDLGHRGRAGASQAGGRQRSA